MQSVVGLFHLNLWRNKVWIFLTCLYVVGIHLAHKFKLPLYQADSQKR